MKKLILLLLFIPLVSFGQTINQKTYKFVQDPLRPWNKTSKLTSEVNFDITKVQDKYVQVTLFVSDDKFFSSAFHSLATTEKPNYTLFFQLELGGLGSLGTSKTSLADVINRNVPGSFSSSDLPDKYRQDNFN